jgi:hypothetical protein
VGAAVDVGALSTHVVRRLEDLQLPLNLLNKKKCHFNH